MAEKIIQVINSIPWVRCASGNVFYAHGYTCRRSAQANSFLFVLAVRVHVSTAYIYADVSATTWPTVVSVDLIGFGWFGLFG